MQLTLKFDSTANGKAFLAKTGEKNLKTVNIGLINTVLNDPHLVSATVTGAPIEFHVRAKDGTWATELVADPVARIKAGEILEPTSAPVKMLSAYSTDMIAWQNRIANRYQPFVAETYFATLTPQRAVEVILVDSGVNKAHVELADAAIEDLYKVPAFTDTSDTTGHGTALASLVVGKTLGVNKAAKVKVVKISDTVRKPTLAELGDAIDAIYDYHQTSLEVPKVVNMSWSIPTSQYLNEKLTRLIDSGLMLVAAGGNVASNIDDATPAGLTGVFTVAATTADDKEFCALYGTNKKIDIYAPGEHIGIADYSDVESYSIDSGSSYSAAITTGVASLLFGLNAALPSAEDVQTHLQKDSTFNALILDEQVSVTENRLLHRPDTASLDSVHTQYLGCFPVNYKGTLMFDLKVLMPSVIFDIASPSLVIVYGETTFADVLDSSVDETGKLRIKLKSGATLASGTKIERMSLSVTGEVPGASAETTTCYIFIASPDATTDDTKAALEDLNAITEFAFLEDTEDSGPAKVKFPGSDIAT